jgi:hypothetical protein
MTQLDHQTREALCALDQPPPGVEDRLFAAILQTTGGGGDIGGGDIGGGDGGGSQLPIGGESALAYAAKVVGATLGLTAAGFALVAASAIGVRSLRTPERATAAITSPSDIAMPSTDSTPETRETLPSFEPEPEPEPDAGSDEIEPDSAPPREPSDTSSSNEASTPAPTLEAELALLELARHAAPREALAALERHRVEFQHGMLADEREVLRVETLCALGRASEAQTIAQSFLADRPDSPLRSRLEPACKKS